MGFGVLAVTEIRHGVGDRAPSASDSRHGLVTMATIVAGGWQIRFPPMRWLRWATNVVMGVGCFVVLAGGYGWLDGWGWAWLGVVGVVGVVEAVAMATHRGSRGP